MSAIDRLYNQGYGVKEIAMKLDMDPADVNLYFEDMAYRECKESWDGEPDTWNDDESAFASAGMGTDESYFDFGGEDF